MNFVAHSYKFVRRIVLIAVGFSVLLIGILMIVLPGPAFLVIPAGLAILATELVWARRLLKRLKNKYAEIESGAKDFMKITK